MDRFISYTIGVYISNFILAKGWESSFQVLHLKTLFSVRVAYVLVYSELVWETLRKQFLRLVLDLTCGVHMFCLNFINCWQVFECHLVCHSYNNSSECTLYSVKGVLIMCALNNFCKPVSSSKWPLLCLIQCLV